MHITRHLTYANVVSTLCLFVLAIGVVGGGVAYAHHAKIGSADIKKNAIKAKHISKGAVKAPKIRAGAVKTGKLANGAVNSAKIQDGTIQGNDFARDTEGVALAGVRVAPDGTVLASFNRLGGTPTVSKVDISRYNITIPGANFTSWTNTMGVTTGGYNRDCFQNFTPSASTMQIRCSELDDGVTFNSAYFTYILYGDASSPGFNARIAPRKSSAGAQ